MRYLLFIYILLVFASCDRRREESLVSCVITCKDPGMIVCFESLPADSVGIVEVKQYYPNGYFNIQTDAYTSYSGTSISAGYDYEIVLPESGRTFKISEISFTQLSEKFVTTARGCMGQCYNSLDTMKVLLDGQTHSYRFQRTNQYEHTLFL